MNTADWITSTMAGLSLLVSVLTAYFTLFRRPRAVVGAHRRIILVQVENVPCLVVYCTAYNPGVRTVYVEDLVLKLSHRGSGSNFTFCPVLLREQYNVFQDFRPQDFEPFKSISVGPREGLERAVVFKPLLVHFSPSAGTLDLEFQKTCDVDHGYSATTARFSIELDQKAADEWSSPVGSNRQIEAVEIGIKRRRFLESLR